MLLSLILYLNLCILQAPDKSDIMIIEAYGTESLVLTPEDQGEGSKVGENEIYRTVVLRDGVMYSKLYSYNKLVLTADKKSGDVLWKSDQETAKNQQWSFTPLIDNLDLISTSESYCLFHKDAQITAEKCPTDMTRIEDGFKWKVKAKPSPEDVDKCKNVLSDYEKFERIKKEDKKSKTNKSESIEEDEKLTKSHGPESRQEDRPSRLTPSASASQSNTAHTGESSSSPAGLSPYDPSKGSQVAPAHPTPVAGAAPYTPPQTHQTPPQTSPGTPAAVPSGLNAMSASNLSQPLSPSATTQAPLYSNPTTQGNVPATQGNIPVTQGNVPATQGNIPATQGNIPATQGNAPVAQGNVPATQGNIPATQGNVPVAQGNVPVNGRLSSEDIGNSSAASKADMNSAETIKKLTELLQAALERTTEEDRKKRR